MRIKQNKSQLEGVVLLLNELIAINKPQNIAEKLVYTIVKKAFDKMRIKSELLKTPQAGWSFTLTDTEAMAIYVFLQNCHIPSERYPYEAIQLNTIINEIDKSYA